MKRFKAWIAVWAIIIASILIAFEYGKVAPAAPNMMEILGISYTTQGLMMTMFSLAAVAMAAFGGNLIDRFGARKVVGIALAFSVIGNLVALFWTTDAGILVTRALEGCGYGAVMTAGPGVIAAWYEPKKRALANGVWGANVGFGFMICTLCATPIMENGNWTSMWIFGLIGAVLSLLLVVVLVVMPPDNQRKDLLENVCLSDDESSKHGPFWGYMAPLAILAAVMFFLTGGPTDAFNSFTIPYLNVYLGWEEGIANMCSSIAACGMLIGAIVMGYIFAFAKDKGMVLLINILLMAVVYFLWFRLDLGIAQTYVIAFVSGCIMGAAPTFYFAITPDAARSPKTVAAATAVVVLGMNIATLSIPAMIGMILDSFGYEAASAAMGTLAIIAAIICLVFRNMYNKTAGIGKKSSK
ncbi:MAG: MFS transporter [Coriobacteriales bacterium]|jgi:MFS family permease|nr:MFS transporter [Coriobacteriales bacterium]